MELIAEERSLGLGGIYRHARIVAHMGMRSAGIVEERRLAAVGVAHQCHLDGAATPHGFVVQFLVVPRSVFLVSGSGGLVSGSIFFVSGSGDRGAGSDIAFIACLGSILVPSHLRTFVPTRVFLALCRIAHHLYHRCLLVAQRHLIAHQLVFHRVLQRCVEQHLHGLALDESHLNDALAESSATAHLHDDTTLACLQFG